MSNIDWSKRANYYRAAGGFFVFLMLVFALDSYLTSREVPTVPEYAIYVNDRLPTPSWMPVRVYVENGDTLIEFETSQESKSSPVLFVYERDSKPIRYTVKGNLYRVSGTIMRDVYLVGPSDRPGVSSQVLIQPQHDWKTHQLTRGKDE